MSDLGATAIVRVEIELSGLGTWSSECSVDQIEKQAAQAALNRIERAKSAIPGFKVVGSPEVTTVLVNKRFQK